MNMCLFILHKLQLYFIGLRSYPARLSYCKINNLETETKMNNFARSTYGNFHETVEDESVSIEFGMDPVMMITIYIVSSFF